MPPNSSPLSTILPPLICGTGTFNSQYNPDPFNLPTNAIVRRALTLGVRAFDTSPYYGPSEDLLGTALAAARSEFPREDYFILTKVGRIGLSSFDYSPAWIRESIKRSLKRLQTGYLDVVYCHDVEFVSPSEALEAILELRRIRDEEGTVKYVGVSGYPVNVLCEIAELVLQKTEEPLDAVQSYANYTLQNTRLASVGLERLKNAGVAVVPNASMLGMGLLRRMGTPVGGQGDWHPAPVELRKAVRKASEWCDSQGEKIEKLAIRYSMESWLQTGAVVGTSAAPSLAGKEIMETKPKKLGVSVMGVSNIEELEETVTVWRSILDTLDGEGQLIEGHDNTARREERKEEVLQRAQEVRKILGEWADFAWASPDPDFVNQAPSVKS